jgi:hypothetical protein
MITEKGSPAAHGDVPLVPFTLPPPVASTVTPFACVLVTLTKEEHIQLRWAAQYWQAQHRGAVQRLHELEAENAALRARIRELEANL